MLAGLLLVAIVVVLVVVLSTGSSKTSTSGGRRTESIFQDDQYLLYEPTPTVVKTLGTLRSLGVDEIRVTVLWRTIAPGANSPSQPAGFVASDPAAYPAAGFVLYDRLVELARNVGIGVDFNVTAAGPLWAMQGRAPQAHYAFVYQPSARDFGQFVVALGRRYSGSCVPSAAQAAVLHELGVSASGALPRVSYWSIWNEPNQPGWLAPQWRTIGGSQVMESPVRYRHYVDAAWKAFAATGHGTSTDTVLVGELAPEGGEPAPPGEQPIAPIRFLQALYCVGASYQPLTGSAATELGCPAGGGGQSFASEHPGLFDATGFAHHPYSFFLAPNVEFSAPQDAGFVPLVSLSRLENGLDRIFGAYGLGRKIPIYLSEYGYETNPPNPFRPVTLQQQAMYIDEAQYMAWNDPRVRSMS